jgi:hypothetical protein
MVKYIEIGTVKHKEISVVSINFGDERAVKEKSMRKIAGDIIINKVKHFINSNKLFNSCFI